MPAARHLYEKLTDNVDPVRGQVSGAAGRDIAVDRGLLAFGQVGR